MRKLLLILCLLSLKATAQTPMHWLIAKKASTASFSPKSVSGLLAWVYSDTLGLADNDPVPTWTDLSGNGNDANQATALLQPTYKTNIQNGRAILRYNGTADFMEIANTSLTSGLTGMTIFAVVKEDVLTTNKAILCKWDYATDGTFAFQTSNASDDEIFMFTADVCTDAGVNWNRTGDANLTTAFYLLTVVYDGSQATSADRVKFYRNGTLLTLDASNGTLPTALTSCSATIKIGKFGGGLTRYYNGDMGEIALYNSAIGGTDLTNLTNYFKNHWGL